MPKRPVKSPYYSSSDDSESSRSRSMSRSPSHSSSSEPSSSRSFSRSPSPVKTTRRKSAYMYFCDVERRRVMKEHPNWTIGQVSTELGKRWKKVSERVRHRYENKAKNQ